MSERNDGGPAFPVPSHQPSLNELVRPQAVGMSLRDYFAAKAMHGFCANPQHAVADGPDEFGMAAKEAYEIADAMLAARCK